MNNTTQLSNREQTTEFIMQVESYHYDSNDTKQHPTRPDRPKLDQCIDNIIQKEGYISCDVEKKSISTQGGNYLGYLYEVDIKGKTEHGEKETPIFVKAMAPDVLDIELISIDNVYNKELFVYKELSQIFNELQDEVEIPVNERFKRAKSYDESYSKAIILENVTRRGFKTWFRMDCVTLDMAETCIKQLARFHGLSFALENKRPDYFENTIKSLEQPFLFGTARDTFSKKFTIATLNYLDEDMRDRVEDSIFGVMEKYSQYLLDEGSRRCVCHGDYRPNNIMVKEVDGKVIEAIPVDYQLIHYGCPILDFFYFMYTGSDLDFRRKHMTYLKDVYFETLEKYLQYFDVSVESVYPRKTFEREYAEKRDYGIMVSVLFLPFVLASAGDVPDLSKEKIQDMDVVVDGCFRDRIVSTCQEFIELGVL